MENCIFCKIISGEIPSYKVYEDSMILAFLDVNPNSNGHTLIVPKKHYLDLLDIDEDYLNQILKLSKNLGNNLKEKLNYDGFTLIQNNGDCQEVKHFHFHLIPYYNNKLELMNIEETYKILSND